MSNIKFLNINNKNQKYKLSDIIIYAPKSHLPASNAKSIGKYRFFKSDSTDIQYFSDIELVKGLYIIMNDGGLCDFKIFNGTFAYSDHCICFKSKENTKYLYQLLLAFKNKINNEGFIGGGLKNIDRKYFNSLEIQLPNLSEQQKIADMLCYIDKGIEKNKLKIKKLKDLKYSLLNKMFPKENSNIPELRFKGFTDAWEQRKLGDKCKITMGQSPDGSTYSETPSDYILVQGNADLKEGWVFPRIWTTQKTKTAHIGDLIMSVRAPVGSMGKTAYDVVLGRGVAGITGNEFIYHILVKMDFNGYWKKFSVGSTFESINSDVVKNANLVIPKDINEQTKIGDFFSKIDSLIVLHQRKYDKLVQVKKALLSKMFV